MTAPRKKAPGWGKVRPHLSAWAKPALLALVKDIYATSEVARDLVDARCQPAQSTPAILEKYRRKIVEQFFPARGFGKLRLGEARQAIRDYRKSTGSVVGTAELLMTYVENGAEFTRQFGDIDERFYNSVESTLDELATLLRGPARGLYPQFSERLGRLKDMTVNVGWGFHDYIVDVVVALEEECGGD